MASFAVSNYMEGTMLTVGWIINNGIWDALTDTGIALVPFIALIASEWFKARQEGDDEGNKGVLSLNRIESRLYAMLMIVVFTCVPVFTLNINPVNLSKEHAEQCGTSMIATGKWGESTMTMLDGKQGKVPMWWALVHSVSKGLTNVAISKIPCSTDYQSIRTALDLTSISDPGLKREVGEFQLACFGPARNKLFQSGVQLSQSESLDVDWIGSKYFLDTAGYYDSFYASRPIPGFPFDMSRDQARPGTGPGKPGYPTCNEWWSEDDAGLMDRLIAQVDTSLWSEFQSIFPGNASAEEYMVRRMVSPRSGAANGNTATAVNGYSNLGGGFSDSVTDAALTAAGHVGNQLIRIPFQTGMTNVKQSLEMIQGLLLMAIIICLPIVLVGAGYSFKVAGTAMFALFGLYFLSFWWELARWLESNLIDLLYQSEASKLQWLGGAINDNDQLILGFVSTMMFLVLPAVWMGTLGWTGYNVGSSIGSGIDKSSSRVRQGGESGAQKGQSAATQGKL